VGPEGLALDSLGISKQIVIIQATQLKKPFWGVLIDLAGWEQEAAKGAGGDVSQLR
jgi:hypothetical protein